MAENAEENAEKYALLALEYNPESPTALSLLASIRLSQTRVEEATELLQQSLSKWLGVHGAITPPYAERINLVKLLIEIELYSKALEVLETMEREDEENVELWYLYTCAYYHDTEESKEESWKSAKECAEMCLKLYQRMEWDDEELKSSCQEILNDIQKSGIVVDKEEDGEGEGEEEEDDWESEDEDADVEMEDAS
jgi:tetratricopeptide (TPR) repeat protein